MTRPAEALAAWDALDPDVRHMSHLFDHANSEIEHPCDVEGCRADDGDYALADEVAADVREMQAEAGEHLADALRDLLARHATALRLLNDLARDIQNDLGADAAHLLYTTGEVEGALRGPVKADGSPA